MHLYLEEFDRIYDINVVIYRCRNWKVESIGLIPQLFTTYSIDFFQFPLRFPTNYFSAPFFTWMSDNRIRNDEYPIMFDWDDLQLPFEYNSEYFKFQYKNCNANKLSTAAPKKKTTIACTAEKYIVCITILSYHSNHKYIGRKLFRAFLICV